MLGKKRIYNLAGVIRILLDFNFATVMTDDKREVRAI